MNTTFYGRINDKEYTNQQEFLNDLQNAQEVTNMEYRYTEVPQSAQVEKVVEDKSTESCLVTIFRNFAKTSIDQPETAFEQLKNDIIEHFDNVDDEFIESDLKILQDEMKELCKDLVQLEKRHKHNANVLEQEQIELDKLKQALENQTKKVESLKATCEKETHGLELWSDLHEFMVEISQEAQDWIDEYLHKVTPGCDNNCHCDKDDCNCGDEKCCDKCQHGESKENFSKPDWMSQGYFNLLKEIFG